MHPKRTLPVILIACLAVVALAWPTQAAAQHRQAVHSAHARPVVVGHVPYYRPNYRSYYRSYYRPYYGLSYGYPYFGFSPWYGTRSGSIRRTGMGATTVATTGTTATARPSARCACR